VGGFRVVLEWYATESKARSGRGRRAPMTEAPKYSGQ
jgi:hypothetical protein